MIVAKLTISYDRGTAYNKTADIGAALKKGDTTAGGGVVRGLGSHFRSQADMLAAQTRDKEAYRIYHAFRERFMTTTIDGLYIIPAYGVGKDFVAGLNPSGIEAKVSEFELFSTPGLDAAELGAWGDKVKRQLASIGLGRKKQLDDDGVSAIKALAGCPLLAVKTQEAIRDLVSLLEAATISRSDFKKRLDALNIEVKQIDKAHEARVQELDEKVAWASEPVASAGER